jgi:hypothetical protein
MKKNAMLKIAAILMVAVLLTTCAISSTFAKYVTDGASVKTNQARVAKWGLDITTTATADVPLFLNSYDGTVTGETPEAIVVAPGTSNADDKFAIKVTGKPEVSYRLIVEPKITLANWNANGYYCPLAITVDGTTLYGNDCKSMEEFAKKVEDQIAKAILGETPTPVDGKYSKVYAPNTEAPATARDGVAVSWEWAFDEDVVVGEGESAVSNPAGIDNDKDTILGNNAAKGTETTIHIQFKVSAEQVD